MRLFTREGAAQSYQISSRPPGGEGQGCGGVPFPWTTLSQGPGRSPSVGIPAAPCVTVAWLGWGVGEWRAGRGRSGGCLGTPCPLGTERQSTLVSPSVLGPMPLSHPLAPFQDCVLFCVEMGTPGWA